LTFLWTEEYWSSNIYYASSMRILVYNCSCTSQQQLKIWLLHLLLWRRSDEETRRASSDFCCYPSVLLMLNQLFCPLILPSSTPGSAKLVIYSLSLLRVGKLDLTSCSLVRIVITVIVWKIALYILNQQKISKINQMTDQSSLFKLWKPSSLQILKTLNWNNKAG
jgi:hypothetical protein